jgi:hypothetical protein
MGRGRSRDGMDMINAYKLRLGCKKVCILGAQNNDQCVPSVMASCIWAWLASHDTVYLISIKATGFAAAGLSQISIDMIAEILPKTFKY